MTMHKYVTSILFLTAAVASGATLAEDTRFYAGFSAGQARPRFDQPTWLGGIPATFDSSDSAWKIFGGYQFNQNFGVEANYVKFGTYALNANVAGTPMFTDININAWGASLVGTLPMAKDFSLFGKAGMAYTRTTLGTCSALCQLNTTFSGSNVWSPTVGVGLKYDFHPNWNVRGEVERYTKVGSNDNSIGGSINLYTIGLAYKF